MRLAGAISGCLPEPAAPELRIFIKGGHFPRWSGWNHDQVFAVVYSLHPLLAARRDGDSLVSNSMGDFIALPPGRHRRARSAGAGGRADLPSSTHAARDLAFPQVPLGSA